MFKTNPFAHTWGIVFVGVCIGLVALALQAAGNPGNMGVCVVCFERDTAGALGFHRAAVVQYLRPEIVGLILGATVAAFIFGDFKSRGGSSPVIRFMLGIIAAIGALVFLGCPWRAVLRLAGGDLNALVGMGGLAAGIFIGVQFFKQGFSLGRAERQSPITGYILPLIALGFLLLHIFFPQIPGEAKNDILFYSLSGPGSMHAPLLLSLGGAFIVGFLAQRSRFCTMGAFRDLFLFRYTHLLLGLAAMFLTVLAGNLILGNVQVGFENQPIAHTDSVWNFVGMLTAGFAFALAGGCPGRQLFLSGEGDSDAGIFAVGLLVGTAVAHNFLTASSGTGIGTYGADATLFGLAFCCLIAVTHCKKGA